MDKEVLDFIIYLVDKIKSSSDLKQEEFVDWDVNIRAKYLLRQVIRQLKVEKKNMYVSNAALKEWHFLTGQGVETLRGVQFRNKVDSQYEGKHDIYKGNSMYPISAEFVKGGRFVFNDVFHEEHIIPVSVIIDDLCNEKNLTRTKVEAIIKKTSICIMLKSENVKLNKVAKSNRPNSVEEVLRGVYKEVDINVQPLY